MALLPGSRIGPYEVIAAIGAGGMGEVYRARDAKLGRDVAIKVLPEAFAQDTAYLARFRREAQILASLNHSNIANIYGLEETAGVQALVMELVEGETLAERIRRGPVAVDEAMPIARQIAEALEAAHEKGIIHRDLKPANIKITPEGTVKVLDFGLAKDTGREPGVGGRGSGRAELDSPTVSAVATQAGVILGTAAYMSPEQAKGRVVDRRTDIFSFGCVLYEMLARRRAFEGQEEADILSRVLQREPDWQLLPSNAPASIHKLLRLCLEKDRKKRRQSAADVRIDIEQVIEGRDSPVRQEKLSPLTRMAWIVAAAALLVAAVLAAIHLRETPPPAPLEIRVQIVTPSTPAPLEFALSPDGRHIVFVASGDGPRRLWLRALDKTEALPMAGTDGAGLPFWSADSRSIGFFAAGKLYRISITGGPPRVLAKAPSPRGGAWNADGTILFAPTLFTSLSRVAASGGEPVEVTRIDPPRQTNHVFPQFLPDGRHFLFYAHGSPDALGIYLGSLDGGEAMRLAPADTAAAYLPPDRVVFVRQGALVAQRLNLTRMELTGDPMTLGDPVGYLGSLGGFSVSTDGRVAYRAGGRLRQLTWFDRTGKVVGAVGEPEATGLGHPELSPDGRRVAMNRVYQDNADIALWDLVRGGFSRFTFDTGNDNSPMWSPDGMRIAFSSQRTGIWNLYLKASSEGGAEELLLENPNPKKAEDWSRDGRYLLYLDIDPRTGSDLWALEMTGTPRKKRVVVNTPFEEPMGQFSPDGRWVAYQTNESGRFEIVVQPFPEPNAKVHVSTGGGTQPRWSADGKELYFIALDGKLLAAPVSASGSTFEAGTPLGLFPTRILAVDGAGLKPNYAVSRDGRFLITQEVENTSPITLLLNWKP